MFVLDDSAVIVTTETKEPYDSYQTNIEGINVLGKLHLNVRL